MSTSPTSTVTSTNRLMKRTYGKSTYRHSSTFLESNFDSLMSKYDNLDKKDDSNLSNDNTLKPTNSPNNASTKFRPKITKSSIQPSQIVPNKRIQKKSVSLPTMKSNNPFDTTTKNTPTKFVNSLHKPPLPFLLTQSTDLFGFPESDSDTERGSIEQQLFSFRNKRNKTDRSNLSPHLEVRTTEDTPPRLKSPKQDKNKPHKLAKSRQRLLDSKSPKRPKEQTPATTGVELFDVKQPHQCRELGQQQMFRDEVQYLLDGIKPTQPLSTRCLALCSLATECISPLFRRQLSFHQLMPQLLQSVSDAPTAAAPLKLAATCLLYALSRDRSSTELDSDTVLVILQLTAEYGRTEIPSQNLSSIEQFELTRANKTTEPKILDLLSSLEPTESHPLPPKGPLSHQLLALMALQSLISLQKEWLCQQLTEMGALQYVITIISSSIDVITGVSHTDINGEDARNKKRSLKYSKFNRQANNKITVSLESQLDLHTFVLSTSLLTLNSLTKKYPPSLQKLTDISTVQLPYLFFRCIELTRDRLNTESNCIVAYECLKQAMTSITELCNEVEIFSKSIYESAEFLASLVDCVLTLAPKFNSEYQFDIQIIGLMALVNHLAKSSTACGTFLQLSSTDGEILFKQFIKLYFAKQKEADLLTQELSRVISRIKLANSPIKLLNNEMDMESDNSRDSTLSTSQLDRLSVLDDENRDLKVSFPIEYFNSKLTQHSTTNNVATLQVPSTQTDATNTSMTAKEMSDFIREAATSEAVKSKATANFESSILAAMISLLLGLIASKHTGAQSLLSQRMGVDDFEKMATLLHQMLSFYNLVCDSPLAREKTTQLASEILRFFTSYL